MKKFANSITRNSISEILNYYYSKVNDEYFPAILNEGDLFNEKNDLYIKVIAKHKDTPLTDTWMKENLSKDYSNGVFNLVSSYSFKYNSIYGINPFLMNDDNVTLIDQNDSKVLCMEYINSNHKIGRNRILYCENENIMFFSPLIKEYTKLSRYSYEYDLYAEVEYRVLENGLAPDRIGKYFDEEGNCIDLVYCYNDSIVAAHDNKLKLYWLRATVKLDLDKLFGNEKKEKWNIKVVGLGEDKVRDLNTKNYNDDIDAGLVVFSKDAVDEIKKYYYFYDLKLVPKIEHVSSCLVDYFDDLIVFWEGEFNSKLPLELKHSIEKYNITTMTNGIISTAMFNWQLQSRWEVFDDLYPNQQLARIISKDRLELAIEYKLDFYPPSNVAQYSEFIKKTFAFLNLNVKTLNLLPDKEKMLNDILNNNYTFESEKELINNFYGLCYLIVKVVGYEKE